MDVRWKRFMEIYIEEGIPAQFVTYKGMVLIYSPKRRSREA
jgi:hypothetical protein